MRSFDCLRKVKCARCRFARYRRSWSRFELQLECRQNDMKAMRHQTDGNERDALNREVAGGHHCISVFSRIPARAAIANAQPTTAAESVNDRLSGKL